MEQKNIIFKRLKKLIKNNPDGFTATAQGKKINPKNLRGFYAVSLTNNNNKDKDILIKSVLRLNSLFNFNIGGWMDKQTGVYYLDLTLLEQSEIIALSIAKEFNQKAIFNFKTFSEIRV